MPGNAAKQEGGTEATAAKDEAEKQRRREADLAAATHPRSGAIGAAFAGASLSARTDESESEASLKKAARRSDGARS